MADAVSTASMNTGGLARPDDALFWQSGYYRVVRAGDWKLQVLTMPDKQPEKLWLFDLAADPTEQKNLASANLAKVAELKALLANRDKTNLKATWPSLLRGAISIDHPLSVKDKPTDEFIYWNN